MNGNDTVNAEEQKIIHCKECIHFHLDNMPEEGCGFCELVSRTYTSDHFCSDGNDKELSVDD